ncbi:hypothetical protein BC939DRAFT_457368 [Gamsiella multidivaricata]|uniref:uncharacterized protein n=1 Tax=Gamsiella multidivaricata TaxID=101098 RepID=UPI00221E68F2|nr:uncharacterized protein BC939DRAFT_457368 [Gamsiella multidivaricata]KAG0369617.1 hypothetical protein BGZ54_009426 [Gamsiella multidivaricata]KAI7820690.1 hypothetical protein BC939DRAFT_457368 [Gamsiella multidivaricata]
MVCKYLLAVVALAVSLPSLCLSSPIPQSISALTSTESTKSVGGDIITSCTVPNSFAITFDDGPSIWTHELLDYLAIKRVKVTFFVNGLNYNLITDPTFAAVVKRAYDEGHQIGSHTWSHVDISQSSTNLASEMGKLDDALLSILGVRPVYMRPPYGNTSPAALSWMAEHGYKVINWNVDTDDWQHPTNYKADFEGYRKALQDPSSKNKSFISLQHDAEQGTAQVFAKLAVEYVLSKGFNIMPVGACLGDTSGWYRK